MHALNSLCGSSFEAHLSGRRDLTPSYSCFNVDVVFLWCYYHAKIQTTELMSKKGGKKAERILAEHLECVKNRLQSLSDEIYE